MAALASGVSGVTPPEPLRGFPLSLREGDDAFAARRLLLGISDQEGGSFKGHGLKKSRCFGSGFFYGTCLKASGDFCGGGKEFLVLGNVLGRQLQLQRVFWLAQLDALGHALQQGQGFGG